MSKINILDQSVFNKIAAGEVVERPSSVVKELLDNAIDAGATKITVEILDGGIKNITITDNGSGIEPDDFSKVFIAHATSKIKTEKDLESIGTLGFRGEALASIASVSKVKLTSKIATEVFGRSVEILGGEQKETTEVGAGNGTTISVSDLFYNVPARAKFLKKPRSEMAEISNLVERYILCNPSIAFTYIADNKTIYQSTGTNLLDAIYVVYGKNAVENLVRVDSFSTNSQIKITGYISSPTYSKPNRTYQTLSINGRYVNSNLVSTCVYNAYEHFLMKGQFPFYVLNLEIPLEKLDVNVHPNKMEVRFNNSNEIYGNVYNAITNALYNCGKISTVNQSLTEYKIVSSGTSFGDTQKEQKTVDIVINNEVYKPINEKPNSGDNFLNSIIKSHVNKETGELRQDNSMMAKLINSQMKQSMLDKTNNVEINKIKIDEKSKTEEFFDNADIKFVGEIFATYLIIQKQDKVYLIDEHAAHERLLFDRLVKQVDNQDVATQSLLVPFNIDLNQQEFDFIQNNIDSIKKLGFEIEQFGNLSFIINSIPSVLANIDLNKFFNNILSDLSVMKNLKQSDLILEKLMQHSCKSAVRAGKILSANEVNSLIAQIKQEKMQLQCPHGRPVIVELTKQEIEKWFKRIV